MAKQPPPIPLDYAPRPRASRGSPLGMFAIGALTGLLTIGGAVYIGGYYNRGDWSFLMLALPVSVLYIAWKKRTRVAMLVLGMVASPFLAVLLFLGTCFALIAMH